jgi:hypothetical protein
MAVSCCTNRPGKKYAFVIRLMARNVVFLGRASGRARRASVVNTALSYASVNSPAGDVTDVPLTTPEMGRFSGLSKTPAV